MISDIQKCCLQRGVTRLCHFTPSRNLPHIAEGKIGILATAHLRTNERAVLNPTDESRWDGWLSHVCCSIEYPNAWYLVKAQANERLFQDWVILMLAPRYIWHSETHFCPRNSAAQGGSLVRSGFAAFQSVYADRVVGAYGRTRTRDPRMLSCCPTDDQAEVLVKDRIDFADIQKVIVRDNAQAKREVLRMRLTGLGDTAYKIVVVPDLFDPYLVSSSIRQGIRPHETTWVNSAIVA
jgi:hypothetical protein